MLQSKLPKVGTTIFTRMSQLATEVGALNLSQGFPDFQAEPALFFHAPRTLFAWASAQPRGPPHIA